MTLHLSRRKVLAGMSALAFAPATAAFGRVPPFDAILGQAASLEQLHTLIVARAGITLVEEGFHGAKTTVPSNIKSASKSVISAMVGIAIGKGLLEGVDQKIAPLLEDDLPKDPDPRIHDITIGNLLSMQAGLTPTSGPNYGRWIESRNWVRAALALPFVAKPGTGWQYSTGSTHLLSAILTRVGGASTRDLCEEWLDPVEDFQIGGWQRDPQGIYFGGNQVAMSPRSLLAFGELYRHGGRARNGAQVVPEAWVADSWSKHSFSYRAGDEYGYCWFLRNFHGHPGRYAWGFGGQMCYVVPGLNLVVVMTSAEERAAETGYLDKLHRLTGQIVSLLEDPA
jgi:CubicO group peptidase (beta-lactamase class C family)